MLTAYKGEYLYTTNGRITQLGGKALTYHYAGLLASAGTASYTYDTHFRRTSKTVDGVTTNFYYAGDMLLGQKTGSNKIEFMFDSNGEYYGFEYNNTQYFYIKNLQGDVVGIANTAGEQIATYLYDAYGRNLIDNSSNTLAQINPIRYRGYYYDTETGFYYLNSRYYAPEICRFISPDTYVSTGQGVLSTNMFAYCGNNPIMRTDSIGYFWETAFDVISLGLSIYDVVKDPTSLWNWISVALDAASLIIPLLPAAGKVIKGVAKVDNVVNPIVDTTNALDSTSDIVDSFVKADKGFGVVTESKVGWHLGDDITNLTSKGNIPSWTTTRQRYWKNKALYELENYSIYDLERMRKGLAPRDALDLPIELHHPNGRVGTDNFFNFKPLTHAEHIIIHNMKR